MARRISIPSRFYDPGVYENTVNQFLPNTDKI